MELSDEEIKQLLNYSWEQDYATLDPFRFWKEVICYLPPALAIELKRRLSTTLGDEAANLPVLHLDFETIVRESSRPFLQRVLAVGPRWVAIASKGLPPELQSRVIHNVSHKTASWIEQFLRETPVFSAAEVAEAKTKILAPLEWAIQSQLEKREPGQNGV